MVVTSSGKTQLPVKLQNETMEFSLHVHNWSPVGGFVLFDLGFYRLRAFLGIAAI